MALNEISSFGHHTGYQPENANTYRYHLMVLNESSMYLGKRVVELAIKGCWTTGSMTMLILANG